jgi:Omp85 superfamily domain
VSRFRRSLAAALAYVGCLGAASHAPASERPAETRQELWRRLREEKRARVHPYQPAWLEEQILELEKAERPGLLDLDVGGIYPRIQGLAKGSKNAIGGRLWHSDLGGSPLDLHASAFYSVSAYEFYDVQLGVSPSAPADSRGRVPLPLKSTRGDDVFELGTLRIPGSWGLYLSASYAHSTRLPFFGLGPESRLADETTFLQRDAHYEIVAAHALGHRVFASVRAGFLEAGIGPGEGRDFPSTDELFGEAELPGLADQPSYWRLGAVAMLDGRDVVRNPKRGGVLSLELDRYRDRSGGEFSFSRYAVDARTFATLGSPQRVLALRGYASYDDPDPGAEVPFYLQETLGGSHDLRGFRNFRFRGTKLAVFQAEYRWEMVPAIELALFVESGTVARAGERLDFDDQRTSWGAALRLKTPTNFLGRLEWAKSAEGSRLYVRFSPAW